MSALLAVVAGLTQAALIAVWPPRRWRLEREALTKVYRSLSADARRLAGDPVAEVDSTQLLELKETFSSNETQSGRRTPAYRDWHALPERIAATLMAVRGKTAGRDAISDTLIAAADVLAAIAAQSRTSRRDAEGALDRVDAAVAGVNISEAGVAQRLSRQLHRADALRFGRRHLSDWTGALKTAFDVAAGTQPDVAVARHQSGFARSGGTCTFADVPQGYWIPRRYSRDAAGDRPHLHPVRRSCRGHLRRSRGRLCGDAALAANRIGGGDPGGGVCRRHIRDIDVRLHRRHRRVRGDDRAPARYHRCFIVDH
jgi:hypothetical protein